MLQLLHAAAAVPAVVAACCTLTARSARRTSLVAAALMLATMIAATLHPDPLVFAVGAAAMWAAALVGAVALRRTPAGTAAHAMAWHRVGGAVAMALVMLAMALHHSGMGEAVSTHAHRHGTGWDAGGLQIWMPLLAGVAVLAVAAQSAHALVRRHRGIPTAPAAPLSRAATAEIVSMTAMLALMSAALLL